MMSLQDFILANTRKFNFLVIDNKCSILINNDCSTDDILPHRVYNALYLSKYMQKYSGL